MNYLLDTHTWLWFFLSPEKISAEVRELLAGETVIGVSAFSAIEVSQKATARPKQSLVQQPVGDWIREALPFGYFELLAITPEIAEKAYLWRTDLHGDPADRVIAATAVVKGLTVITSDHKLITHPEVATIPTR